LVTLPAGAAWTTAAKTIRRHKIIKRDVSFALIKNSLKESL